MKPKTNPKTNIIRTIGKNAGSFLSCGSQLLYSILFMSIFQLFYIFYKEGLLFTGLRNEPILMFILMILAFHRFDCIISVYHGLSSLATYLFLVLSIIGLSISNYSLVYDYRSFITILFIVPQIFRILNYFIKNEK